ncbi:MAG: hypothetical protein ABIA47_03240 [bacterium]
MSVTTKCVIAVAIICSGLVAAGQALATTIAPTNIDITVEAGNAADYLILIGNEQDVAREYTADIIGVRATDSEELKFYDLDSGTLSWFALSDTGFSLGPNAMKEVSLSVSPSAHVESQVLIAAVRFIALPLSGGDVQVAEGVTSLLFITVGSDNIQQAELLDFSSASFRSKLPAEFYTTIRNSGQQITQPSGTIRITNIFGSTVDVIDLNPDENRVLGGQTRTLKVGWGNDEEAQGYTQGLIAELRQFTMGIFTAELSAEAWPGYGEWSASTRLVVIPWRTITLAATLFIAMIAIIKITRK